MNLSDLSYLWIIYLIKNYLKGPKKSGLRTKYFFDLVQLFMKNFELYLERLWIFLHDPLENSNILHLLWDTIDHTHSIQLSVTYFPRQDILLLVFL